MRKQRATRSAFGFVCLSALLAIATLTAGPAGAAKPLPTLTCTSLVSGGAYGNVVVPDGTECELLGVAIHGSIQVGAGSDLYVSGGSVSGNLFAYLADEVATGISLGPTPISGNVSIDSTEVVAFDGTIGGNASFTNNDFVGLIGLGVGGNLACSGNGAADVISVTVGGHASGQCA